MVGIHRQEVGCFPRQPRCLLTGQTLRAVSVAARVVGHPLVTTTRTLFDMPAKCRRAAPGHVTQHATLVRAESVLGFQLVAARSDDVGQFQAGSFHRPRC
jgi:hypothetical protein